MKKLCQYVFAGTVVGVTAVCAFLVLYRWLTLAPAYNVEVRYAERPPTNAIASPAEIVDIRGVFKDFNGAAADIPGSWPRFRGTAFDNIAHDSVPLLDAWDDNSPEVVWSVDLGQGYAGPAVLDGRVYVLDYDEESVCDALRCFSLADGREVWRRSYEVRVKRNHGMSRTVPAVTTNCVVSIGPKCHVLCANPKTGDYKWGIDLVQQYGTRVPLWYAGQCPLIDGNTVVIAPGGSSLVVGINCDTGRETWRTPNPDNWQMSHSSVMPMTLADQRMYVYCAIGGMVGVAADGENAGQVLWKTDAWDHAVVAPSPVIFDDGRIFVTAGYGVGSAMFQVTANNGTFTVARLYTLDRSVFACEQHTPILYEGNLYSVLPGDAGPGKRQLVCMTPESEVLWTSGKEHRFGLGPFLVADGRILVLNDSGVLTMADASDNGYVMRAQKKVLEGRDSWGPMALVDGRLLLRSFEKMICLDLRRKQP